MKRRTIAVALVAVAVLITGCTAKDEAEPSKTPSASTPSATPAETPTPTPDPVVNVVGSTVELSSGSTVAVLGYEPASAPEAPLPQQASSHWVSIDVQVCNNTADDGSASTAPWTLRDSDSRSYESSSTGYNQFPNPQYAWGDVDLFAGECLRGWITFPVLDGATLTNVRYVSPSTGDRVDWVLG
ncbi:hypothetical protein KV395_04300 [Microbacterium luteolum]|uniref:DUF4352 domain-containing protein n=1 Tax=Microbacterium luteolum TaxID=69367 RepID=A0ABY7XKE0_MICLT|nr:hypothetical protein [Microbacterium luteolum]WDM42537.1 hypothetical protein KV395_04300 [Microbacterium luteolum]